MDTEKLSDQQESNIEGQTNSSLGMDPGTVNEEKNEQEVRSEDPNSPLYVQKRLKQQKRIHEREIYAMNERINGLQRQLTERPNMSEPNMQDSNNSQGNANDDQIHRAVSLALKQRDESERKARETEQKQREDQENRRVLNESRQKLQSHLDQMSSKYPDFEEKVLGEDVPIPNSIAHAASVLPTEGPGAVGHVLYKLANDPDNLERISKLHPAQQLKEMVTLSHALIMKGNSDKVEVHKSMTPLKSNPAVNSSPAINDKTSVKELRELLKKGWKK